MAENTDISISFGEFVGKSNNGFTDQLARSHLKKGKQLPAGRFVFKYSGDTGYVSFRSGKFYRDGRHSAALGIQDGRKSLYVAITSFSFRSSVRAPGVLSEFFYFDPPIGPVIEQLQGPSRTAYRSSEMRDRALEILDALRWERLLVRFISAWAQEAEYPYVYVQPSRINKWPEISTNFGMEGTEKGRLRYDITALRCGFRLGTAGLYSLKLPDNRIPMPGFLTD